MNVNAHDHFSVSSSNKIKCSFFPVSFPKLHLRFHTVGHGMCAFLKLLDLWNSMCGSIFSRPSVYEIIPGDHPAKLYIDMEFKWTMSL